MRICGFSFFVVPSRTGSLSAAASSHHENAANGG